MPQPAYFKIDVNKYGILRDTKTDENYYASTFEEIGKMEKIIRQFNNQITNVPDEYTITVIPIVYTGKMEANLHIYILNDGISIEFQINRLTSVNTHIK